MFAAGRFSESDDYLNCPMNEAEYRAFVDDALRWSFLTGTLSELGQTTIIGFDEPIDHVLASDEAAAQP